MDNSSLYLSGDCSIFYASNFSIGVNIYNEVSKNLARLISQYPQYKTSIEETHHIHKVDKPSGTAITLANKIIDKIDSLVKESLQLKKLRIEEWKSALFGIWFLFTVFLGFLSQFGLAVLLIKYIFTN